VSPVATSNVPCGDGGNGGNDDNGNGDNVADPVDEGDAVVTDAGVDSEENDADLVDSAGGRCSGLLTGFIHRVV